MILKPESQQTSRDWVVKLRCNCLLAVLLALMPSAARGADGVKAIFIKSNCAGKSSSVLLSSLRNEISASLKYRLTETLDDDGQMDTVFTIFMKCSERESVTAIASVFGQAKCFSKVECHFVADGSSFQAPPGLPEKVEDQDSGNLTLNHLRWTVVPPTIDSAKISTMILLCEHPASCGMRERPINPAV